MATGITAINIRNQFKGNIKEIIRGSVVSEVEVQTPFGIVTSVITTRRCPSRGFDGWSNPAQSAGMVPADWAGVAQELASS